MPKTAARDDSGLGIAFRPRARLIRALGQELISSETVAIIELVKNSYDADATRVKIKFTGSNEPGGVVEVMDDGHGMDLRTVQTVFMEPATNAKRGRKSNRRSPKYNRQMLGEKGIGRFAAARLANELEMYTRRSSTKREVFAYFDWKQFDDDTRYLDEVLVLTEEREPGELTAAGVGSELWTDKERQGKPPRELSHGTLLRMTGLRKQWDREAFVTLERGLARLVAPFKKSSDFSVYLDLPEEFSDLAAEVEAPALLKYPHYSVKGSIEKDGSFKLRFRVHEEDNTAKQQSGVFAFQADGKRRLMPLANKEARIALGTEVRSPSCGPLEIDLRFWDRDQLGNIQQQLNAGTILDIRRDLDAIAGINLYRDDFRVLPYGEPNDDWLRLDIRRVQKPQQRFSNNNIAGYVSITADGNPDLVDQTNREGLDENRALTDLRGILVEVVRMVEERRQSVRPKQGKARSTTPVGGLFEPLNLDPVREQLRLSYPDDKIVSKVIDDSERVFAKQLEEIQTVLGRYHALATLGKLVDVVLHDGRHPVATVVTHSELAVRTIENQKVDDCQEKLGLVRKNIDTIRGQGELLRTLFRRIEPFGGRKRGKPTPLYMEKIVENVLDIYGTEIKRLGVAAPKPKTETLVRVDEAEIQEVLANLIDNSLYWLQQVPEDKRRIEVKIRRVDEGNVEITVADSGPGVPRDKRHLIFEPYFSTKPDGVGLGLSIAGEIVSDYYGGTVELLNQSALGGAMFRLTLKKRV
jgi:signal transduction histidine kinase